MPFVLVTYDISNDRRRTRLHAFLLSFGTPVQESVFECDVSEAALRRLRSGMAKQTQKSDNVRIYPLCQRCRDNIEPSTSDASDRSPDVFIT